MERKMEEPDSHASAPDDEERKGWEPFPEMGAEQREEDMEEDNEPYNEDFACIRCGYNLRGLPPSGNCPECGSAIRKSLNFALERILCLACMRPAHPSIPKCPHCGAPMNSAASMANYWQITPRGVTPRDPKKTPAPEKPFRWPIIAWILLGLPAAFSLFICGMVVFMVSTRPKEYNVSNALLGAIPFGVVGAIGVAICILVSRGYKRRLAKYQRQVEEARGGSGAGCEALLRPPLPPHSPVPAWIVCTPLAVIFFYFATITTGEGSGFMLAFGVLGVLMLVPAIRAQYAYSGRRETYRRRLAAYHKARETPAESAPATRSNEPAREGDRPEIAGPSVPENTLQQP
jgi:hypothetical protein